MAACVLRINLASQMQLIGHMVRNAREAAHLGNVINLVMGIWLIVSAFVLPHAGLPQINTIAIGALIALLALGSLVTPPLSWVNALPAVWLFGAGMAFQHQHHITSYNNIAVSLVVFLASLTPLAASPQARPPGEHRA
jgi:hypothetical protein